MTGFHALKLQKLRLKETPEIIYKLQSPELLAKYATFQVTELLEANKLREACSIYLDYGVMPFPEHIQTYKVLQNFVLQLTQKDSCPTSVCR